MAVHEHGMDHGLYAYQALADRPKLAWPNHAPLAVCINLFFECMLFDTPPGLLREPRWRDRFAHDPRLYTWYEYGNRVAIFRILELLDRYGLKVTVAANAAACERYPYLVDAFRERGWEIAAHGLAMNAVVTGTLGTAQEQAYLAETISRIEKATGQRPVGWFSPDMNETIRTPRLLHDAGLSYLADWSNDEQPYPMPGAGGIISVPNYCEWDDMRLLWDRRLQMPRYPEIVGDAVRQLHQDGAQTGRFFSLNLHPWMIGAAHRIKYLEQVLAALAAVPDAWHANTRDVVRHCQALWHGTP